MFLGIDLVTGSVKAMLLDRHLDTCAQASRRYENDAPRPGWAEIAPQRWWQATIEAVRECIGAHASRVSAIGLSGQSHGLVLADRHGEAVRPAILWYDQRTKQEIEILQTLAGPLIERLGNPVVPGMTIANLLWMARHEPEALAHAAYALTAKDWLRLRLTGEAASEPSDASATLLYDLLENRWQDALIEALTLPKDLLPPITPSTAKAGTLRPDAADALGLPEGLPVAAGAADAAAALLGLGVTRPGQTVLQVGTGIQIMTIQRTPIIEPAPRCNTFRAVGEHYYRMAAMQNGGTALTWAEAALDADQQEMYRLAFEQANEDSEVIFLPYVSGERTPHLDTEATGSWLGLRIGVGRAELARAVFEGIAFAVKDGWNALRTPSEGTEAFLLTGGGSADPRWRQLLADVIEMPLQISPVQGGAARGAALLGALACGALKDLEAIPAPTVANNMVIPQTKPRLQAQYQRFCSAYRRLHAASY